MSEKLRMFLAYSALFVTVAAVTMIVTTGDGIWWLVVLMSLVGAVWLSWGIER